MFAVSARSGRAAGMWYYFGTSLWQSEPPNGIVSQKESHVVLIVEFLSYLLPFVETCVLRRWVREKLHNLRFLSILFLDIWYFAYRLLACRVLRLPGTGYKSGRSTSSNCAEFIYMEGWWAGSTKITFTAFRVKRWARKPIFSRV